MEQHKIMNGTTEKITERSIMDSKPIVTYAGDKDLFLSLESTLSASLPLEATEWRRSYGRAIKFVNVTADFVPFTKDVLPKEGDFHLTDQPMFHTYWTQCSDVEVYKSTIRDDIEMWMRVLTQYNLMDWMIVVVETYDFRKSNKLIPRSTVYDKIRSDYGAKHADRCLSVINPLRSESRSAGSWRGLVVNTRLLLLTAYDRTLLKFEELIREQRERRNQAGWSFTKYFLLQEELAFVLEMLGVYEEALVQYDELDALFTQFILNSNLGETPSWLTQFQSPLDSWDGLCLSSGVNLKERSKIENNSVSLLQFRNYLFSRQCAMLLFANKPSEVAERTLPFLHNCIRELSLLDVTYPQGAVACWVFLSCIEILHTCENYTESNHVEQYSRYTAGIWAYARQKLADLGQLCGLMPGQEQTSEQLHIAVQIFSGLGDDFTKPVEKLKRALSSQQEFCKQYLELSELAMGTYKHIGRVRCARSLGFDLAKFYWSIKDHTTATSFLQNALHCYEQDGWKQLAANARLNLAHSYSQLGDILRYAKMCVSIASSSELPMSVRVKHYDEMLKILETSKPDPPWTGTLSECMSLTDVDIKVDPGSTKVSATLSLTSNLPVEIICPHVSVALLLSKHEYKSSSKHKDSPETIRRKNKEQLTPSNPLLQKLPMAVRLDYKQDKSLAGANLELKNQKIPLKRQDSHGRYRKITSVSKSDFSKSLMAKDVSLKPGTNTIVLTSKETEPGNYKLGQFCVTLCKGFELLSLQSQYKIHFEVMRTLPTVTLSTQGDLLAGLLQTTALRINSLGYYIPCDSIVKLKTSNGLTVQRQGSSDPLSRELSIQIPEIKPNSSLDVPLCLYAQLPLTKESHPIEHTITLRVPWAEEECCMPLRLEPALGATVRTQTARLAKFLLVTVSALSSQSLMVHDPAVTILCPSGITISPVNPPVNGSIEIGNDMKVSYMWKLDSGHAIENSSLKTEFTLYYEPVTDVIQEPYLYKCAFDINNFKTLFVIECKVEPTRGNEFCRVSTVCHLTVKVTRVNECDEISLMYEVLAEHNMWAVCGRTAGVMSMETDDEQTVTLDVMPLINGFLPLPTVRLSKYIPANTKSQNNSSRIESHSRLEPFSPGQVYNVNKGSQVHVITAASPHHM